MFAHVRWIPRRSEEISVSYIYRGLENEKKNKKGEKKRIETERKELQREGKIRRSGRGQSSGEMEVSSRERNTEGKLRRLEGPRTRVGIEQTFLSERCPHEESQVTVTTELQSYVYRYMYERD